MDKDEVVRTVGLILTTLETLKPLSVGPEEEECLKTSRYYLLAWVAYRNRRGIMWPASEEEKRLADVGG